MFSDFEYILVKIYIVFFPCAIFYSKQKLWSYDFKTYVELIMYKETFQRCNFYLN